MLYRLFCPKEKKPNLVVVGNSPLSNVHQVCCRLWCKEGNLHPPWLQVPGSMKNKTRLRLLIIWLGPWAGKINRISGCDWLPERVANEVNKFGYERWLIHKQPRQDFDLCSYSFARYSEKCYICWALYGGATLVPFKWTPTWQALSSRNKRKIITPDLQHIVLVLEQELLISLPNLEQ